MPTLAAAVTKEDLSHIDAISARRMGVGRSVLVREALQLLFAVDEAKQRQEQEWTARMKGEIQEKINRAEQHVGGEAKTSEAA